MSPCSIWQSLALCHSETCKSLATHGLWPRCCTLRSCYKIGTWWKQIGFFHYWGNWDPFGFLVSLIKYFTNSVGRSRIAWLEQRGQTDSSRVVGRRREKVCFINWVWRSEEQRESPMGPLFTLCSAEEVQVSEGFQSSSANWLLYVNLHLLVQASSLAWLVNIK